MFAFLLGVAALCAVNIWVGRSIHDQHLHDLPTGLIGS